MKDLTDSELEKIEQAADDWTDEERGQSSVLRLVVEVRRSRALVSSHGKQLRCELTDEELRGYSSGPYTWMMREMATELLMHRAARALSSIKIEREIQDVLNTARIDRKST